MWFRINILLFGLETLHWQAPQQHISLGKTSRKLGKKYRILGKNLGKGSKQ
jgi:hypothetical protein